ncbi:MAG: response regulator transcription factor [Phycisphaerae bacterium]
MTTTEDSTESNLTRIAIVDDHPMVRQGIRVVLQAEGGFEVCGEAESVSEALQMLSREKPDLAIVDLHLKNSSGLELIKDVQVRQPDLPILVLSMRDEGFYAERVLRAGARGYVTKEEGPKKIVEGIRRVLAGDIFLSDQMASKVMSKIVGGLDKPGDSPMDSLTDRELEVFELIGQGLPTREVAQRLHISPKTVDSHREHIKEKLKLDNSTDLLKHAIEWSQYSGGNDISA